MPPVHVHIIYTPESIRTSFESLETVCITVSYVVCFFPTLMQCSITDQHSTVFRLVHFHNIISDFSIGETYCKGHP